RHGDLLFVRTNGNPDYVGRCAVFDLPDPYLFASYLIRARLRPGAIDPWYLVAFLHSEAGRATMAPFIRTTAGQSNISASALEQLAIPLPVPESQRRFRDQVEQVRPIRRRSERAGRALRSLFDALLRQAFSGQLTAKWREA